MSDKQPVVIKYHNSAINVNNIISYYLDKTDNNICFHHPLTELRIDTRNKGYVSGWCNRDLCWRFSNKDETMKAFNSINDLLMAKDII